MEKATKSSGIINRNFFLHIHARRVHIHSMKPTYTFGLGIILGFLFLLMLFTGVILMVYYTPSVDSAYQSVKDITTLVPGGRIIRNMHRWASQGMIIFGFLHLLRVYTWANKPCCERQNALYCLGRWCSRQTWKCLRIREMPQKDWIYSCDLKILNACCVLHVL